MSQPWSCTSRTKYHRPRPPLSVNSSRVNPAVDRDLVRRITMNQSSGGKATASIQADSANDCGRVAPVTVNSEPKKSARKW